MLTEILIPINPAGWPFIGLFALVTAGLFLVHPVVGWAGVVLTLWCAWFFRDPERFTPLRKGLVIAPADGRVCMVKPMVPPEELGLGDQPRTCIAIFMNVFNVHVNRVPVDGTITKVAYRKGKFVNASLDKASEHNERMALAMTDDEGRAIAFVQIAGLVARRIKCDVHEDQMVKAGQRFGLIRFGSRVDVYLPDGVAPLVAVGQTIVAGETVLADLDSSDEQRLAEPR